MDYQEDLLEIEDNQEWLKSAMDEIFNKLTTTAENSKTSFKIPKRKKSVNKTSSGTSSRTSSGTSSRTSSGTSSRTSSKADNKTSSKRSKRRSRSPLSIRASKNESLNDEVSDMRARGFTITQPLKEINHERKRVRSPTPHPEAEIVKVKRTSKKAGEQEKERKWAKKNAKYAYKGSQVLPLCPPPRSEEEPLTLNINELPASSPLGPKPRRVGTHPAERREMATALTKAAASRKARRARKAAKSAKLKAIANQDQEQRGKIYMKLLSQRVKELKSQEQTLERRMASEGRSEKLKGKLDQVLKRRITSEYNHQMWYNINREEERKKKEQRQENI
jgi:hypothetical protein